MKEYDVLHKLLLVGEAPTGKTSMLLKFCDESFSEAYISTIGVDFKVKTVDIGNKSVKMQIWDTAGQERFRTITSTYYRGCHGAMIVFDITNRETFEKIDSFYGDIEKYGSGSPGIILIGTHSDLQSKRQVSIEEATAKANHYGIKYLEVSAKTGDNISKAFEILNADILGIQVNDPTITPSVDHPKIPAPVVPSPSLEEAKGDISFYKNKLDAIEKVVKILGADGSMFVDNLRAVISAKPGQKMEVDEDGTVKLTQPLHIVTN